MAFFEKGEVLADVGSDESFSSAVSTMSVIGLPFQVYTRVLDKPAKGRKKKIFEAERELLTADGCLHSGLMGHAVTVGRDVQ